MFSTRNLASGAVAGIWAGAAALVLALVFRLAIHLPTTPELIEDRLLAIMPGSVFSFLIDTLGFNAKPLFFVGLLALQIGVGAIVGFIVSPIAWRVRQVWPLTGILMALILWQLTFRSIVPAATPTGQPNPLADSVLVIAGLGLQWLVFGLVFGFVHARLIGPAAPQAESWEQSERATHKQGAVPPPRPIVHSQGAGVSRRTVTASVAAGLAAVGLGAGLRAVMSASQVSPSTAGAALASSAPAATSQPAATAQPATVLSVEGLSSEITPVSDFYTVSKNFFDPVVPRRNWKVDVTGLVEKPLSFDQAALEALPATTQYATLSCISNEIGGDLIGNAQWKGVPLGLLLTDAKISTNAVDVVFHSYDGYADSIPVAKALDPLTLAAYEMNGEPLNDKHGAPLRMIVPNIYGMKNAKWVTKIEVVDTDFQGYWQMQGWDDAAPYQILTRIDTPAARNRRLPAQQPVTIGGVAFAGNRGIKSVEVSVDGGKSWQGATIKPPFGPLTWALWTMPWTPDQAGSYRVMARSTDGEGTLQESRRQDPFPAGATGYHTITLQVV